MATKECISGSGLMLYQYLYDTCNSSISYNFITTVNDIFPDPIVPVLKTSGNHAFNYYDNYYGRTQYVTLTADQCKIGCQISYERRSNWNLPTSFLLILH